MTEQDFHELLVSKLDQIISLLEILAFDAAGPCQHEHSIDIGTMGTLPGTHLLCQDCGQEIRKD